MVCVCMCVCVLLSVVYACVCVSVCTYVWEWTLMCLYTRRPSGVFLNCSPPSSLESGSHWLGSHWFGYDVLIMSLAAWSHCRSLWFGPSLRWNKNSGSVSYLVSRCPWKGPGAITHCYETDRNDRVSHASTESVQAPEPTLEMSNAVAWGHYLSTGEEKRETDRQTPGVCWPPYPTWWVSGP